MTIDKDRLYTVKEIAEAGFFGVSSREAVRRIVFEDKDQENYLQLAVWGKGNNTRYYVRGRDIIKYNNKKLCQ